MPMLCFRPFGLGGNVNLLTVLLLLIIGSVNSRSREKRNFPGLNQNLHHGSSHHSHSDGSLQNAYKSDASSAAWIASVNVSKWYTPLDLCLISNDTAAPIEQVMAHCEAKVKKSHPNIQFQPMRCRAGNSWPSHSGFCSAADVPYSQRQNLRRTLAGFDDPTQTPLKDFFTSLALSNGSFLMVGDSVMQQFYGALACELEREGVWTDPSKFTNTDELRHVEIRTNQAIATSPRIGVAVPIKFAPIYHFVNGRFDRVPNASMIHLQRHVSDFVRSYDTVVIVLNMGLHYVSNPVAHFSRPDYISQMTAALQYLHSVALSNPKKNVKILWRETTAQHFPTPSGYWPGQRYAAHMKVGCVPINDTSPNADWRNSDIPLIIKTHNLYSVKIIPFFNITVPLWTEHVNGHKQDCTHFCWTPFLYQYIFHYLAHEAAGFTSDKQQHSV